VRLDGASLGRQQGQPLRLRHLPARARSAMSTLRQVTALAWRASPALTLTLGAVTVVAGLIPAANAAVTRLVIDSVAQAVRHGPAASNAIVPVLLIIALQFAVGGLSSVGSIFRGVAERLLGERLTQLVQVDVMRHASRLELPFFEDSASYDLLRQAQQEAATRPTSMISQAFAQIQGLVTLVSLAGLLVDLSPLLALAAILGPIPVFVSDARYGRRMFDFAQWASPLRRRMQYTSGLVTTDTAAKEVKLFGLGPYFVDRFRDWGEDLYRRTRSIVTARALGIASWGMVTAAVGSAALLFTVREVLAGRLSIGDLVLCLTALVGVQGATQGLLLGISAMYQDGRYLGLLRAFLAVPAGDDRPGRALPRPDEGFGHVVFERVSFSYPGSARLALEDVSVEILPGQTLAVVGRNGAGKSTLMKLLCGLYEPTAGRITLDGHDLRELDRESLRRAFGAMFQDYVAYQATVAENIGFGDVGQLDDRVRVAEVAAEGGAAGFVERLPGGYDTQLGRWFDGGVEISGGQWQKLALSRAFMRDAPLLLLDEPTAALDAQAEFELFERLRRLAAGRTTVYVSHRFSTVRRADRILLLDGGRVREYGTHDELIARNGEYDRLYRLQATAYMDLPQHPESGSVGGAEPAAGPDPRHDVKGKNCPMCR
jgi:ATP-binding cassette subfamily B protein